MKFGLLLYPDVEPIDLAAIGVVSMARRVIPSLSYVTIAGQPGSVTLSNGLRVLVDLDFTCAEPCDVLVVPGGPGWSRAAEDGDLLDFVRRCSEHSIVLSVCTGAMILAAAGLLDGRSATTKVEVVSPERSPLEVLADRHPAVRGRHALIVDSGRVLTGGGVSLCIDAVFYLIEREFGIERADEIARIMEYRAARDANRARLEFRHD